MIYGFVCVHVCFSCFFLFFKKNPVFFFFLILNLPVCFLRKKEGTELDGWEGKDLGADERGKTIIRIDYMKNLFKHYEKLLSFY